MIKKHQLCSLAWWIFLLTDHSVSKLPKTCYGSYGLFVPEGNVSLTFSTKRRESKQVFNLDFLNFLLFSTTWLMALKTWIRKNLKTKLIFKKLKIKYQLFLKMIQKWHNESMDQIYYNSHCRLIINPPDGFIRLS